MKKVLIFSNRDCDRYVLGCNIVGLDCDVSESLDNLEEYDGLILVGGGDLNPELYGQKNIASRNIEYEFDKKCMKCTDYFVKANKAILGICKGIQLINVQLGGTLKQDISNHNYPELMHAHRVIVQKSCLLSELYGTEFEVNSLHHQCVDILGKGLDILALSNDGVIEAIGNEKILGVQWHPERLLGNDFETTEGKKVFEILKNMM